MRFPVSINAVLLCALLSFGAASAYGGVPEAIHFQGQLSDGAGTPIHCPDPVNICPSGVVNIAFKLYRFPIDGDVLWEESHEAVPVHHGIFHVSLGATAPITEELLNEDLLFLGLNINNKGQLQPRQRFVSAVYALRSGHAGHTNQAANAQKLGDIDAGKYLTEDTIYDWCLSATDIEQMLAVGKYLSEDNAATFLNDNGYLKMELDPSFIASPAAGITTNHTANWAAAYGWGDHALQGYLDHEADPKVGTQAADKWCRSDGVKIKCDKFAPVEVESDPQFTGSPAGGITPTQVSNWEKAHGWGDHQLQGYISGEEDPKVGVLNDNKWCRADAGKVVCDQAPPVDNETLSALGCGEGQVPVLSGGNWSCIAQADLNTTLNETEVDAMVADNGYLTIEEDPKVGSLNADKWCRSDGAKVHCDEEAPSDGPIKLAGSDIDCTAETAGTLRWTGTAFEGCDGSAWVAFAMGGGAGPPAGTIVGWTVDVAPDGYLECNGASVSRTTYSDLFAAIGKSYGSIDSISFNLPDFRGEFLRGWNHSAGGDPDAGSRSDRGDGTTGDQVGTGQSYQLQSHKHQLGRFTGGFPGFGPPTDETQDNGHLDDGGPVEWTTSAGGGETRPRNISVMWLIKY